MSLEIEITDNSNIKTDIEKLFKTIKIKGTSQERKLIKMIDGGTYHNELSFIDRFGYKLGMSELSTGCKTALCIINRPDEKINTIECGINALDTIISICTNGNIIMRDRGITIVDHSSGKIDVKIGEYRFNTIDRLNYYIFNEKPFKPELSIEGVEYV